MFRRLSKRSVLHLRASIALAIALVATLVLASGAQAASPAAVPLRTVKPFAILAGSTVTNTGNTVVTGDLGVSPGAAVTGFPPGMVNGTIHQNDAVAMQAQSDLTLVYNDLTTRPCPPANDLTGQDLGGLTLTPGVYCFSTSAQLTGTLTLDAGGNRNGVFIFQTGSTLTTASNSSVTLINGGQACNVFWRVGSSAVLGTTTTFVGNILAQDAITATTGTTVDGRLLARTAAVTLDTNTVNRSVCAASPPGGGGGGTTTPPPSPPPPPPPPATTPPPPPPNPRLGSAVFTTVPRSVASTVARFGTRRCVHGFRANVTGSLIRQVLFSLDGHRIATRSSSPFTVFVPARRGLRTVRAYVTFTDSTSPVTLKFRYRSCAAATRHVPRPRRRRGFTG